MPKYSYNNSDANSIKQFQQLAVEKGFLPKTDSKGKSTIDGIDGPLTRQALEKINNWVAPGVYYLTHPYHQNSINKLFPLVNTNKTFPAGHAGIVIVDNDNNVTQYNYGRWSSNVIGKKFSTNKGNWTKKNLGKISTIQDLLHYNKDKGANASPNVRLTYIDDADPQKVLQYIKSESSDSNRLTYGIAPFSPSRWDNFKKNPSFDSFSNLFKTKNCARSAQNAINAGIPTTKKIYNATMNIALPNWIFNIKNRINGVHNGILGSKIFPSSVKSIENFWQKSGYETFDSEDYEN